MKDEIRRAMKIKRRYFENVRREVADLNILDYFLAAFEPYESFFIYNSFGSETRTDLIISALIERGKKVYLPRVEKSEMVAVPYGECKKGEFGIEEPLGKPFNGEIDVTVIPLLAVNDRGFRIGYGKGFYDRYLKSRKTKKVGLGYSIQIADFLEDEWDIPLDEYICEKGIITYEIER
jgi:5-formyltetrahydrofolate cyclo-ligase